MFFGIRDPETLLGVNFVEVGHSDLFLRLMTWAACTDEVWYSWLTQPDHVPKYVIHVENLPWAYRIVGIYVQKTYCKFGACINCNILTSCSSQFLFLSILLNINKASDHCDCLRTIKNVYGQCIETDRGSLRGSRNLIIFLPREMRLLFIGYCVWSFSHYPITDDHVVYIREGYRLLIT